MPLNDEVIVTMSQLVDDAFTPKRKPSHADIEAQIRRFQLEKGDPNSNGQNVGKAKRVYGVLNWAMEYNHEVGESFVSALLSVVKGHGGFRESSPNFVGIEAIKNLQSAFKREGVYLTNDGDVTPAVLENLSDMEMEKALMAYIRRAKKGASDAALLTGTSKDLLEAVAAHVLNKEWGKYPHTANFPTLLGQTFYALGLATPNTTNEQKKTAKERLEVSLYELGCAVNNLRNKEGTGHGRPFLPTVTDSEAKAAIESMGMISEFLLNKLKERS